MSLLLPVVLPAPGPFTLCHHLVWPVDSVFALVGPGRALSIPPYHSPAPTAYCFKILHCHTFKIFPSAPQATFVSFLLFLSYTEDPTDPTQGALQEIFDHLTNSH